MYVCLINDMDMVASAAFDKLYYAVIAISYFFSSSSSTFPTIFLGFTIFGRIFVMYM